MGQWRTTTGATFVFIVKRPAEIRLSDISPKGRLKHRRECSKIGVVTDKPPVQFVLNILSYHSTPG